MKIIYTLLLLIAFNAKADDCQSIVLDDQTSDYKVFASATKGLHIKFWENVKFGILSNDILWKAHSNPQMKNHFWLFSKNMSTQDNIVGSTFILESGRNVNLVVQQKLDAPSCLVVSDSENKSVIIADFSSSSDIFTNHTPKAPLITSSYLFPTDTVKSAYDDSRFTYVQLNGFSEGDSIYSVVANSNDKKRVISNPTFNSITNTYTLPGIHDELLFQNENNSFSVKRK